MSTHGKQIMQAVTLILEGEHNIEVKEQVCVPFFWRIPPLVPKKILHHPWHSLQEFFLVEYKET